MVTAWKIFSAAAALLLLPGASHGQEEVTTCEELQAAFELAQTQDVNILIHPAANIECATHTNMTMSSPHTLTVNATAPIRSFGNPTLLRRVRFDVTGGAKLFWETNVWFDGIDEEDNQDNDGGAVFVGEDSTVRFWNDVEMTDVSIFSATAPGSDNAQYTRQGGCVWTSGYFRVDGTTTLTRCDNEGGGEAPPGNGGAVYVTETGSVLFNEGVTITETYLSDDEGGRGAGIYNLGKVNIKGNSRFEDLRALSGGAIYNGENAILNFRKGSTALFRDMKEEDGGGTSITNLGFLKFSGPALFVDAEDQVTHVGAIGGSETIFSEDTAFWDLEQSGNAAIFARDDAELKIPNSVTFVGFAEEPVLYV